MDDVATHLDHNRLFLNGSTYKVCGSVKVSNANFVECDWEKNGRRWVSDAFYPFSKTGMAKFQNQEKERLKFNEKPLFLQLLRAVVVGSLIS